MRPELAATNPRRNSLASIDSVSCNTSTLLAKRSVSPTVGRSLGTHCLDSSNPHQHLTSFRHGSVVVRRLPSSSRQPLLALLRTPKDPCSATRGHALSDTPHRQEHLLSRSPPRLLEAAHELSNVQTPVIVSISRCALASSSRLPSSRRLTPALHTIRCFASSPRHHASARFELSPSTLLALARCHVVRGARQARSLHLTVTRMGRSHGSHLSGTHLHFGKADGSDPGRHRPMSAAHDSIFKTGTRCPGSLRFAFPARRGGSRFTTPSQSRGPPAASRGHCLSSQRLRVSRGCFVACGFPGRNWRLLRAVESTGVPRFSPARMRQRASRTPPDGLGLRHRVA